MIKRQNRQKKSKVLKTECTKTECIERQNDRKDIFLQEQDRMTERHIFFQ